MKPVYEIKFLSNKDFDNLPKTETNGAEISDSMGFYNPFTNRVFIRHTAIPELDRYLLDHEFGHLIEKDATDEDEFGIRHKKKRGFAKLITQAASFFSPVSNVFSNVRESAPAGSIGQMFQDNSSQQQEQQLPSFGGLGIGLQGSGTTTPTFGSSQSPLGDQQSTQGGLNQGLNSQTINPLSDPYSRYGQQQGRLFNF